MAMPHFTQAITDMRYKRFSATKKSDLSSNKEWKESRTATMLHSRVSGSLFELVGIVVIGIMALWINHAFPFLWQLNSTAIAESFPRSRCLSLRHSLESGETPMAPVSSPSTRPQVGRRWRHRRPRCFICNKPGHIARNCWFRLRHRPKDNSNGWKGADHRACEDGSRHHSPIVPSSSKQQHPKTPNGEHYRFSRPFRQDCYILRRRRSAPSIYDCFSKHGSTATTSQFSLERA